MKIIYKTIFGYRSFGSGIPKLIRKNIDEEIYEKIKNKDVNISFYIEIEEL